MHAHHMRTAATLAAVALVLLTAASCARRPVGRDEVARVVDGDTIVVGETTVRLVGIDAPESVHPERPVECFGEEAAARLHAYLPRGTKVALEADVETADRYGRTLAYVHRADDGLFVNLQMVADGFANVYTHPPNVAYVDAFTEAEQVAREADRGLWQACR